MSEQRWDEPSPKLAAMAGSMPPAQLRDCPACPHRHAKGEQCGYPVSATTLATCRCMR